MRQISLRKEPNQRLRFNDGDSSWELTIKAGISSMVCTIDRNGERVISSVRVVAGYPIIPYKYLAVHGNFAIIDTSSDDEPIWWERFGETQVLVYWRHDDD